MANFTMRGDMVHPYAPVHTLGSPMMPAPPPFPQEPPQQTPYITYDGPVHYVTIPEELNYWCNYIRIHGVRVLGFDTEWRPEFRAGENNATAVVQLCFRAHGKYCVVVCHVRQTGMTRSLKQLLEDPNMVKPGIGLSCDKRKLREHFEIELQGAVELQRVYAKQVKGEEGTTQKVGTTKLVNAILGRAMQKSISVSRSDWEKCPLTETQLKYAALDAFVALRVYEEIFENQNKIGGKPGGHSVR